MDTDDLEPRPQPAQKKDLDPMSIEEMEEYILELKAEIARVEQNIEIKKRHREGVEGLFKK